MKSVNNLRWGGGGGCCWDFWVWGRVLGPDVLDKGGPGVYIIQEGGGGGGGERGDEMPLYLAVGDLDRRCSDIKLWMPHVYIEFPPTKPN